MTRCCLSRLAAWRTRSSALVALSRHCVRRALRSTEFPLASSLPSTASATADAALFGGFAGTMELSDFPRPFVIGFVLRLPDALCRMLHDREPWDLPVPAQGVSIHAPGLATARGPSAPCHGGTAGVAFRYPRQRRHPEVTRLAAGRQFRGSIPGLHVPRSTLRLRPYGRRRMTWGRCGRLRLHRMTLSFTTPAGFSGAPRTVEPLRRCNRQSLAE